MPKIDQEVASKSVVDVEKTKLIIMEYVKKLTEISTQAESIHQTKQFDSQTQSFRRQQLNILFQKLNEPTNELIQRISQLIEHGKTDDLVRWELRLYLAELEYARDAASQSLFAFPPNL